MTQENKLNDPLLNPEEVSRQLRVKASTLAVWRCNKQGPKFVKVGRLVFYRQSEIEIFINLNSHGGIK